MERLPRNISESYSESEEVQGNPSEPLCITVGKQQNKNPLKYQGRSDFRSNSTFISEIQKKCFKRRIETSFPDRELAKNHYDASRMKMQRQVIELNDNDSKMSLRRLFKMAEIESGNTNLADNVANYEDVEILRKLPPDTTLTKQETKANKEDSDYTRELTETNSSGGSSSTSSYMIAKVKRIPRAVRNKTRETIEVRRNPIRVSKKDIDKDFPRPRQRLLTNKRETCINYESGKRSRISTMPYMNTRSVTRKMYNVGATYQAPTRKDEMEWREWPVHGMHERPVFHPQAGLAVEYLGRYFTSLDGLSYYEIIDEPEIEVVAVDPHYDQRPMSAEKKLKGKAKAKTKDPLNFKESWNSCLSKENKYFETCMHGSLHCVLGYCSQVVTPSYKRIIEDRRMNTIRKIPSAGGISSEAEMKTTNLKNQNTNHHVNTNSVESVDKFAEENKLYEGYAIAIAQTAQNKNTVNYMTDRKVVTSTPSTSSGIYFPEAQKSISTELENSKITPQTSGMKLKRILRNAPNSSLILLRSSGAKTSGEINKVTNPMKLENSCMNDDTLMESIYKKFISSDESLSNHKVSPARNSVYTLKKHTMTAEDTAKKAFLETQLENIRTLNVMKDANKNRNVNELKVKESDSVISMTNSNKNRMWCTNETSEIAKILSEYNRSTTRKSAIQSQTYGSDPRNVKTNLINSDIKNNFWQKTDRIVEENRNMFIDRNTDLPDHPQRKWKRFQVTLEKPKNTHCQIIDNNQNVWNSSSVSSDNNRQTILRDQQMKLKVLNHIQEKSTESRKNLNEQCDIIMIDAKPEEAIAECSKDGTKTLKTERLQELLENTAVLYCAANGVHQEDLTNYIDTLDSKQSIQWLENWNNHIV